MLKPKMIALCPLLLSLAAAAYADGGVCPNPMVSVVGTPEPVFQYQKNSCAKDDFPDTPAMAYRDSAGTVHLFNGYPGSYMSVGTDLNSVQRVCNTPFFPEAMKTEAPPQDFDNWHWLRNPWTNDGKTIYALVHNEFHGWETNPALYCPSKSNKKCWYPNIIAAQSNDGGNSFSLLRDSDNKTVLAMVTPYMYEIDGGNIGFQRVIQQQANTISRTVDGKQYYYIMVVRNQGPEKNNAGGNCLMRNTDVSNPSTWMGWDGNGFNIVMNNNPYQNNPIAPSTPLCKPVLQEQVACSSWTYNTTVNQYMAICTSFADVNHQKFVAVFSPDMYKWGPPQDLMSITTLVQFQASKPGSGVAGQGYPSMLDPDTTRMNFDESGTNPYLYYTNFNAKPAQGNNDWRNRDVMRVKLEVKCGG